MLSERLEDRQRMSIATPFQGSLFANDFFRDSIARLDDWSELDAAALDAFEASVRAASSTSARRFSASLSIRGHLTKRKKSYAKAE